MHNLTQDTIDHLRSISEGLSKATWTQPAIGTDGLQYHNLEPVVKHLYPVLTPVRNWLPRNANGMGTAVRWKAITGINTNNAHPSVTEGKRGQAIEHTYNDYLAAYKGIGLEDYVTFEAGYSSKGLIDADATARVALLKSLMMQEEIMLIGGNVTDITTPGAPTGTLVTGGSMATSATYCSVVALTLDGFKRTTLAAGCPGQFTKTNIDGSTDTIDGGNSASGNIGTATPTGGTLSIRWSVTDVPKAVGYVWYTGTTNNKNALYITAITSQNYFLQTTAVPSTGQLANDTKVGTDFSGNAYAFDGLIPQIAAGGYIKSADVNAEFVVDASGSVDALDAVCQYMWNTYKIAPDVMLLNANTSVDISKKVLGTAGNHPNISINVTPDAKLISVGQMVGTYRNKWAGGKDISFMAVPDMNDGQILMLTNSIPYDGARIPSTWEVEQRQPYYSITWPLQTRRREYGVYCDEVLKGYAPFSCAFIKNYKLAV